VTLETAIRRVAYTARRAESAFQCPTRGSVADDYAASIWWLDPGAGPGAGLSLPTLPAGWAYEGWVVGDSGPVSTGTFTAVTGADSDGAGATAGSDPAPAFPGQDFISPLTPLTGLAAVISVEPSPDNSPAPFTLKPLVDMDVMDVGVGVVQAMTNNAVASSPTGTASRPTRCRTEPPSIRACPTRDARSETLGGEDDLSGQERGRDHN
jgi:hypothetical protein